MMELQETRLFKNWWLLFLKGALIMIFGMLVFIKMFPSISSLRYFGFIIIFNGCLILFGTFYYKKNDTHWILWFSEGTIDVLLGIALLTIMMTRIVKPHIMYTLMNQIVAIWALMHGILHTISAFRIKDSIRTGRIAFYAGMLIIPLALLLLIKPIITSIADHMVIGTFSVVIGLLLCTISVILRKIYSD